MERIYRYRIYANRETIDRANYWLDLCRKLYNCALQQRIMLYKQNKVHVSFYQQAKELTELKQEFPEYYNVCAQSLQKVLKRLDEAFQLFFKSGHRFPRFKPESRYNSFTLNQKCWKLINNHLYISNLGIFKVKMSRVINGKIKTLTIKRESNKWFVYIFCDIQNNNKILYTNNSVGIDVGVKELLVDSFGNKVKNGKFLNSSHRLLRMRQRRFARRKYGSNRREEAKILIAKAYEKVFNQRTDYLHKISTYYVSKFDNIYIEKLSMKWMLKNKRLSKYMHDSSWARFFDMLSYKAESAGKKVIKVDPKYTSIKCSRCGEKVDKKLTDRIHDCPFCGVVMDRDENAAKNILRAGQALQALTCAGTQSVACESFSSDMNAKAWVSDYMESLDNRVKA